MPMSTRAQEQESFTMMSIVLRSVAAVAAAVALAACSGASTPAPEGAAGEPGTSEAEPPGLPEPAQAAGPGAESAPEPGRGGEDLLAAEKSAFERAEPVFRQYCARCHARGGAKARAKTLDHFDMTGYPFGGHHAAEITASIREVLGIGGGEATMPMDRPGAVQGEELQRIAAWADAYDRAAAGGAHGERAPAAHEHGEHEHRH
jgi:hypothetical protein